MTTFDLGDADNGAESVCARFPILAGRAILARHTRATVLTVHAVKHVEGFLPVCICNSDPVTTFDLGDADNGAESVCAIRTASGAAAASVLTVHHVKIFGAVCISDGHPVASGDVDHGHRRAHAILTSSAIKLTALLGLGQGGIDGLRKSLGRHGTHLVGGVGRFLRLLCPVRDRRVSLLRQVGPCGLLSGQRILKPRDGDHGMLVGFVAACQLFVVSYAASAAPCSIGNTRVLIRPALRVPDPPCTCFGVGVWLPDSGLLGSVRCFCGHRSRLENLIHPALLGFGGRLAGGANGRQHLGHPGFRLGQGVAHIVLQLRAAGSGSGGVSVGHRPDRTISLLLYCHGIGRFVAAALVEQLDRPRSECTNPA